MQATAFISHASADAPQAARLAALLEQRAVRCWIAPRDVTPGQPYAEEIVRGIEGCAAFVLFATTASLSSRNVLNELEQAHRSARTVYTLMVNQPKLPSDASYYVARLHWLQTDGTDLDGIAARLSEVMSGSRRWEAVASPPSLTRSLRSMLPAFSGALAAIILAVILLALTGAYVLRRERHKDAIDYRSLGWTTLENVAPGDTNTGIGRLWLGDPNLPFSRTTLQVVTTAAGDVRRSNPELPSGATGQASFSFPLPTNVSAVETLLAVPSATENATFCVAQRYTIAAASAHTSGSPVVTQLRAAQSCQ